MAYGQKYIQFNYTGNKIFKKILTENALEYLASGKGFIGDRIVDARNLNYNLKLESRNSKLETLNTKH